MKKSNKNILIIGASGQIGSELTASLRKNYKPAQVVATDLRQEPPIGEDGPFYTLDVTDKKAMGELFDKVRPSMVYNLASLLSATAEQKPKLAWKINVSGLLNCLDCCLEYGVKRFFWPSSIAVFGPDTPRDETPQKTVLNPNTVYGISKLTGERWCDYYWQKHRLDVRGLRYPGLISYKHKPGGGTTDYAIDIFFKAVEQGRYTSFLDRGTRLPMMHMPDAIRATLELMEAPVDQIKIRDSYNLAGMSFAPEDLAAQIRRFIPDFKLDFEPDYRQQIADSWPSSIDDSAARRDWKWKPEFDLNTMSEDMIRNIRAAVQRPAAS